MNSARALMTLQNLHDPASALDYSRMRMVPVRGQARTAVVARQRGPEPAETPRPAAAGPEGTTHRPHSRGPDRRTEGRRGGLLPRKGGTSMKLNSF